MGEVVESTELVSHGVADTEECVCECHTCHRSSVSHLLTCLYVGLTVIVCSGKVLKDHLESAECKTVSVVGCEHCGVSLNCVGYCVDTRSSSESLGSGHMEIGVDDCHVGKKLVVSKRILHTGLFVGDNCERSNLRAGTCGGRNCDEVSLFTHLGEGVDSLTDINESHCHIHKVCFRMLVENPHDLCSVHCGTAAECDDGIGLECSHKSCTLGCVCKGRIRLYVKERGVLNAHLIELIGDRLGVAVLVKEAVGYNECLLCASYSSELVKSNGEATLLDINLLRCSEPKHIFSPLGYCFNVKKVLNTYVFGYAVTAPRAATQGKGRSKLEVVKVSDTTVRGRSVNEDTAGLHTSGKGIQLILFGHFVKIYGGSMTIAAIGHKMLGFVEGFTEVLCLIHSKYGRKLLVSKLFGKLYALNLTNEDLCTCGNCHACELCDLRSSLTNDLCVECAVDDDGLTNLFGLHRIEEIAASCRKLTLYCIVDRLKNDNRLLGCADHTVIKGLGMDDRVNCEKNVCGIVDDCGSVTCTNTESGLAAGVSSLNHSGATGCEDDISLFHNRVGHFKRRNVDPVDDSLGSTCCNCCFENELSSRDGGVLCSGVRADDDCVTSLECEQALEDCGRCGVGGRNYGSDDTDRLSDLLDAVCLVFLDNAAGLGLLVSVVNVLGCVVVLNNLILYDAHAGLGNCELCKADSCLVSGRCSCKEDLVNLLLRVGSEYLLCSSYACDRFFKLLDAVYDFISFEFHCLCPPLNYLLI